ncbi:protein of unknown function [Listeria monocytogenes R479a]|nr:protein of unknown function [Listeria monocytogenes R479a]
MQKNYKNTIIIEDYSLLFFSSRGLLCYFEKVDSGGKTVFLSDKWSRQILLINVDFFTKVKCFI